MRSPLKMTRWRSAHAKHFRKCRILKRADDGSAFLIWVATAYRIRARPGWERDAGRDGRRAATGRARRRHVGSEHPHGCHAARDDVNDAAFLPCVGHRGQRAESSRGWERLRAAEVPVPAESSPQKETSIFKLPQACVEGGPLVAFSLGARLCASNRAAVGWSVGCGDRVSAWACSSLSIRSFPVNWFDNEPSWRGCTGANGAYGTSCQYRRTYSS